MPPGLSSTDVPAAIGRRSISRIRLTPCTIVVSCKDTSPNALLPAPITTTSPAQSLRIRA